MDKPTEKPKWRPKPYIRAIVLGLLWQDNKLLAYEVWDDEGNIKGVRPLGGGIDFGERWRDAVVREFEEELNETVKPIGEAVAMENLFIHEGDQGHEIAFVCQVELAEPKRLPERIEFLEANGDPCVARWFGLDELDVDGGVQLFPEGLKARV